MQSVRMLECHVDEIKNGSMCLEYKNSNKIIFEI